MVDFSENTAVSSGDKLPYLEEGCYRVYVRGVNSAGTAGNAKSAGLVRVDRTKPEVESVTFEDSSGNAITDEFTEETNPVINFSGADDTYLETSGIKYALVPKGTTAAGTDFKAAASLTVNDTKPYSGSFRFTAEDQAAESGSYTLSVKFEDRAGNAVVKKFTYNKDNEDPAGSITITNLITGNEESQLYQPVNVELAVSGTGSEIKESSLKLYKATTDSTGMIVNGIEEDSEVVLAKNFTMSKNIVVDPFELCDQSGMYRLILYLKDSVGRTKQIKKDVEVVYQLPPPDEASLSQSKGGTAVLTWRFSYNAQHKIKLGSFIGRFGNSGEWEEIVSPRDDGKLPFAGSAEIEVPDEEGIWDLNLKSVDSKGNEGGEFSVKCVVDKTAPSVNLSSCVQGHASKGM